MSQICRRITGRSAPANASQMLSARRAAATFVQRFAVRLIVVCIASLGTALAADSDKNAGMGSKLATLYVSKLSLHEPLGASPTEGKLNYFCQKDFSQPRAGSHTPIDSIELPLEPCANDRVLSHKDTVLRVVYVAKKEAMGCPTPADIVATVEEHARKTAAAAGFAAILEFVADKAKGMAAADAAVPQLCLLPSEFRLVYDRATADVSFALKSAPEQKATKQLITGPTEHWFLSGDAIVKGAKELKYDTDKKAIFARDKPEQLYLGINWMVGDVYGRYDRLAKERLVGKVMLLPSRHPFDSVGLGLGYRFADGIFNSETGIQPTGGFMIFVGHFWTKNDEVDATGNVAQGGRSRSWRFGVSYGLDSLLGWLK